MVERDLLLVEKEKMYGEVKTILARQPGPEVAEQLTVYQASLRNKGRQLKAMASELNMYQAQAHEGRHEVERVSRELQDVKKKYYEQKRREQLAAELASSQNSGNGGPGGSSGWLPGQVVPSGSLGGSQSLGQRQAQQQLAAAQTATTRFAGGGFAIK